LQENTRERLINKCTRFIEREKSIRSKIDRRWIDRSEDRNNKKEKDMVEKIKDNNFYL
jgi:disulfide oxidoreductase YuzD